MDAGRCVGRHAGRAGRGRSRRRRPPDDRQHDHPRTSLCCGRKRGTRSQGLGRSRGGFTTKLHANTDANGHPLGLLVTAGETHDAKVAIDLTNAVSPRPRARLADKGYDTDEIRHNECFHGTLPLMPTRKSRKVQFTVDRALYSLRNRIERYFNRIKNARRVATRFDKTSKSFLAFVEIASVRNWLRFVNAT